MIPDPIAVLHDRRFDRPTLFVAQHLLVFYFIPQSLSRNLFVREENDYGFFTEAWRSTSVGVFQRHRFSLGRVASAGFAGAQRARLDLPLRGLGLRRRLCWLIV